MKKVIIYGIGSCFYEHQHELQHKYDIVAYADRNAGIEIGGVKKRTVNINEAVNNKFDLVLCMVTNISVIFDMLKTLSLLKIPLEKIAIYNVEDAIEEVGYFIVPGENSIIFKNDKISLQAYSLDEFNNLKEILSNTCYYFNIPDNRKSIVFDIGMNIGGASLYFASRDDVERVYAFEPFKGTYKRAIKNFANNKEYANKIEAFDYGISDINETRNITYNPDMSCGESTLKDSLNIARENYDQWNLINKDQDIVENITVKNVTDVFYSLIKEVNDKNIIFKIDCEGEEYNILPELHKSGIINAIDVIMLEYHYNGSKALEDILSKNGFKYFIFKENSYSGLIYAMR